jgi:1H-pyrrole-2-carbonyl-[peptidyl-carrier protein] chlorinase
MSPIAPVDFDVAIIGGGPAGASMAAYLAREGVSCVVLEKDIFPRPHVGESLVPSSTRVFAELGFLDTMEKARFPHKFGAAWTAASSSRVYTHEWDGLVAGHNVDVQFDERKQTGVEQDYTYHVDRGLFDTLLLQHAHSYGAKVYEGVRVDKVDTSGDTAMLTYNMGRKECSLSSRLIVDASGRHTLVGRQKRWRLPDSVFNQCAIHTWFEGFDRGVTISSHKQKDFIFVHFLPLTNTWVWQIPITDTITSIGVVTQRKNLSGPRASREEFFWDCLDTRPELATALRESTQLRPLREEGDYSYAMSQLVDDRLLLVGDAGRFVDPIFSTGVSIALSSSRFAHKDVIAALESGNFGASSFSSYQTTMKLGTRNWYRFISVYYRLNVLFTAFVSDPRYRLDVLKLLQGDVYDDAEPEVLTRMQSIVKAVEANPKHVWHDLLGDLTANEFVALAEA